MDYLFTRPLKEQKTILRKECIHKRSQIFPEYAYDSSNRIADAIIGELRYEAAKNVLMYANYSSEMRTDTLFIKMQADRKNIYYPRVEGDDLYFCLVHDINDLTEGYKGIPEPYGLKGEFNNPFESIVIVPGCVFGMDGYRIGYGKGFYDRFLSAHKELYKIGLCYDCQLVERCPHEKHDIKMNQIITEKRNLYIR